MAKRRGFIEEYYDSHNVEDSIGIFDGEKYYPQDFNEWLKDYAQYEIKDYEHYHDEELKELFNEWCNGLWSDSGNEYNYEPDEEREKRLAERLFDCLIEDDKVVVCGDGYLILTEAEAEFLLNNMGWMTDLYEGKLDEFAEAFEQWEDEK